MSGKRIGLSRRAVNLLAFATTIPAWIVVVGLCFHTSFDPDVFGKYTWGYLGAIGASLLLVVISFLFGRFIFGTQTIRLSRRSVEVRPRVKIIWAIVIGSLLYAFGSSLLQRRITRTTGTIHTDVFHPYLQNVPRPGRQRYTINNSGFRGEEIELEKGDDTFRVFVLGGSTVFCGDVPIEDTHCGVLQRELRRAYPNHTIEVQNAGVDWHSSAHSVIKLLMNVQDFDPDLIIVFHAINDILRSLSPDAFAEGPYRRDYSHYYGAVANYVHPRSSGRFMLDMYFGFWCSDFRFDRIRVLGPDGNGIKGAKMLFAPKAVEVDIPEWKSVGSFERNMRDLVTIARAKGIPLLMANQPYFYRDDLTPREREVVWFPETHQSNGEKPSIASMIAAMELFNGVSERIAAETGTRFVDLERVVPKTLEYFYDDVHYTRPGNAAVAQAFLEAILDWGIVDETFEARAR